jgi:myo-inositol 2-dehydrogenase / D-chiro-inositol 1-dehydrogenase
VNAVRYGLTGTGMMGVEHIQNLAITPGATLCALADPEENGRGPELSFDGGNGGIWPD